MKVKNLCDSKNVFFFNKKIQSQKETISKSEEKFSQIRRRKKNFHSTNKIFPTVWKKALKNFSKNFVEKNLKRPLKTFPKTLLKRT